MSIPPVNYRPQTPTLKTPPTPLEAVAAESLPIQAAQCGCLFIGRVRVFYCNSEDGSGIEFEPAEASTAPTLDNPLQFQPATLEEKVAVIRGMRRAIILSHRAEAMQAAVSQLCKPL